MRAQKGALRRVHDGKAAHHIVAAGIGRQTGTHDLTRDRIHHADVVRGRAALQHLFQGAGQQFLAPGGIHRGALDGGLDALPGLRLAQSGIHGVAEDGAVEVISLDVENRPHIEDRACGGGLADDEARMIWDGVEILHGATIDGLAKLGEVEVRGRWGGMGHGCGEKQRIPPLCNCEERTTNFEL